MSAVSSSVLELTWDEVDGATGYRLRRRLETASIWQDENIVPDSDTLHRDTGLLANTQYCYGARALGVGDVPMWSADVCGWTKRPVPTGLRLTRLSRTSATVAWDALAGADSYVLYTGGRTIPVSGTSRQVGELARRRPHRFAVAGVFQGQETDRSGLLTVTLADPVSPATLAAEAEATQVSLSWPAGSGAGSWSGPDGDGGNELTYRVDRRSPARQGDFAVVAEGLSELSYVDGGLAPDTEYEYRVWTTVEIPGFTLRGRSEPTRTVRTRDSGPENLEAQAASSVSVALSWDAAPGAGGYEFRWSPDGAAWSAPLSAGSGTTHDHTGLNPETPYHYQVRVAPTTAAPDPPWSEADDTATGKLETPAGLAVDAMTSASVTLRWDGVPAAASYELERTAAGGMPDEVAVSGTSHEDTGLMTKTGYSYRVRSVLMRGTTTFRSEWSVAVPAMTGAGKVQNLQASATSSVSMGLSWDAITGAASYEFWWSLDGAAWSDPLSAGSGTSYDHPGLDPETPYHYQVRVTAMAGMDDPPWSDAVQERTRKLETPTGLAVDAVTSGSVTLTWDAVATAESYELERMVVSSKRTTTIRGVASGYRDEEGVTPDTEYEYRVRSVRTRGTTRWESALSASEAATTPAVTPPDNLAAQAASSVSVDLSWDTLTGAGRYEFRWRLRGEEWDDTAVVDAGAATRATHAGRDPETTYEYQVRALAGTLMSAWSEPEQAATTRKLETPTGLAADATSSSVTLTWDAVATAESYELVRMAVSSKRTTTIRGVTSGYRDEEGVAPDTEYEYRVRSVRTRGTTRWESALSASEAVTTPALTPVTPPLTPPDNLAAEAASSVSVDLSWDTVTGAGRYEFRWRLRGEDWDDTAVVDAGAATRATHAGRDPETTYEYQVRALAGTLMSAWSEPEQAATTPKLETPTGLAADATSSSVTLTWDAVAAAESYELVRMAVSSKRTTTIRGVTSGYRDEEGVAPDTEYEYRVRSVRTRGTTRWESALSASQAVTTPAVTLVTPPDVPANFEAEAASSVSVDLSWDTVTGAGRYEFRWRLRGEDWDDTAVVDAGAATRVTHAGRDPETTYEYQVRALAGTLMSAWSEPEQAATTPKLETPTGLAADATSSAVTLTWDAVAAAESYELVRMAVSSKRTTTIRGVTSGYRDEEGVAPDTEYEYRVRSVRTRGTTRWESALSASQAVTTLAVTPVTPPPDVPANLEAEATSSVSVDLSWDAVTGADRYEFRWRLRGAEWDDTAVVDAGAATRATQAGRDPETTYEYQVRALAGTLMSAWSEPEQAATTPKLETPTGLAADATSSSVTLTWDAVAAAESYELVRMAVSSKRTTTIRGVTSGYRDEEGVAPDTEYEYRVRSVRTRGTTRWESALSASQAVTTLAVTPVTPPDVPANFEAEAASSVSVDLSWDAVTGAGRYEFRWRLRGEDWDDQAVVDAGAATRVTHAGRDPETTYEYQVRAVAGTLMSAWSEPEQAATTPKLETPTGLAADATSSSVTLTWDAVAAAESYELVRMAVSSKRTTTIRGVTSGYRDEEGVAPDTEYEYRVRSVRTRGPTRWESALSASQAVTTLAVTPVTPPPDVPANLEAEAASSVSVDLSWDAVTGADRYEFRWRLRGEEWDDTAVVNAGAATDSTHAGRTPETTYEYQVRAVAGTLMSAWSGTEDVTTPAVTPPPVATPLAAPQNLTAEATSAFSVSLSWDAVTGAESYHVRRREPISQTTTEFLWISGTSYEDGDLSPETTYTYDVGSIAGSTGPVWSAPLNESTPEFAGPATFAAQVLGPDSVEVSWDAVPGDGVQYKVRHRVSGTRPWTTHDFTASPGTVSSLKPLTVYDFRIVAMRPSSSGTAHRTDPVNREVTTLAPDPPRLQVDETAADAVELSWTSVTGATGYELQRRSPAGTGTWGTVYGPDSGTSYRDESVSTATEYEYQVRAIISDRGETDWNALSVTTDP